MLWIDERQDVAPEERVARDAVNKEDRRAVALVYQKELAALRSDKTASPPVVVN